MPAAHVALVEGYEPGENPRIRTARQFQARVLLVNRDSILTEQTPQAFAEANGFRMLAAENMATNPAVSFGVERFEPAEGFRPTKPYATRLSWRDLDGNQQSKLLLVDPESVLAVVMQGENPSEPPSRPLRRRPASGVLPPELVHDGGYRAVLALKPGAITAAFPTRSPMDASRQQLCSVRHPVDSSINPPSKNAQSPQSSSITRASDRALKKMRVPRGGCVHAGCATSRSSD